MVEMVSNRAHSTRSNTIDIPTTIKHAIILYFPVCPVRIMAAILPGGQSLLPGSRGGASKVRDIIWIDLVRNRL